MRQFIEAAKSVCRKIRSGALSRYSNVSFGQEGEDLLLLRQMPGRKCGFYVEVGALDPVRFSNTFAFYQLGWNGILVEPNPGSREKFLSKRRRDLFVNEGVSCVNEELEYFQFEEPALNTFDSVTANDRISNGWKCAGRTRVRTRPLADILDEHLPFGTEITVLSIDVEGLDEEVIRSNDWRKYRPEWVIVEILDTSILGLPANPLVSFLMEQDYDIQAKTGHSVIFRKTK